MEASKRPADENGSNGDSTEAKKAKLDPSCGALLFCGTTEWHNVRIFLFSIGTVHTGCPRKTPVEEKLINSLTGVNLGHLVFPLKC